MVRLRRGRGSHSPGTRLFFCTDIHGSDTCFRKFLNAGEFYNVDHLILGGDMTGKLLVPMTKTAGGYSATFAEHRYTDLDQSGLAGLKALIQSKGAYTFVGTPEEVAALADDAERDRVFRKLVYDSVAGWVQLAEERLRGTGRRCYIAPGNDDFVEIDDALRGSDVVEFSEGRVLSLDGTHEMLTCGYANPTPWNTERELPEDRLRAAIDKVAADVQDFSNLVAVLHVPPFASGLDDAPELDEQLGMRMGTGGVHMVPVGSTAVRGFIEDRQPLIALHGHIHEGRGDVRIGRTLCVNPGSEYTEGILDGAIAELGDGVVLRHQLVAG
jgi:uncharacterized protein